MATRLTAKAPKHFADSSRPRYYKHPAITLTAAEPGTRAARQQTARDFNSDEARELRQMLADKLNGK